MNLSLRGVPVPLLFVAGAAFGVLLASLIVLATHSHRTAKATRDMFSPSPIVAPVAPIANWQPNVIAIHPAAPDPMFDTPPVVEPASLSAHSQTSSTPRPAAKKAVTRNAVRRHHPAGKQVASGDLLTAAL